MNVFLYCKTCQASVSLNHVCVVHLFLFFIFFPSPSVSCGPPGCFFLLPLHPTPTSPFSSLSQLPSCQSFRTRHHIHVAPWPLLRHHGQVPWARRPFRWVQQWGTAAQCRGSRAPTPLGEQGIHGMGTMGQQVIGPQMQPFGQVGPSAKWGPPSLKQLPTKSCWMPQVLLQSHQGPQGCKCPSDPPAPCRGCSGQQGGG